MIHQQVERNVAVVRYENPSKEQRVLLLRSFENQMILNNTFSVFLLRFLYA